MADQKRGLTFTFFSYKYFNTKRLETKNGIQGILSLTKDPKFEVASPTENAKKSENKTEKSNRGFSPIRAKKPRNLSFINKKRVRSNIYVFSKADKSITGFFASHK